MRTVAQSHDGSAVVFSDAASGTVFAIDMPVDARAFARFVIDKPVDARAFQQTGRRLPVLDPGHRCA